MIDRPTPTSDAYSPRRRTALLLSGSGTAGAYHAGVLRALHEAGVKIDVVAGRGIGVIGALFAAVDGVQQLWDDKGFWRHPAVHRLYGWRPALKYAVWTLLGAVALVLVPLAAMAAGLVVYPIDFLLKMVGVGGAGGLTAAYLALAERAFSPEGLPTWIPRLVFLVLSSALVVAFVAGSGWALNGRPRGALWWRLAPAPLTAESAVDLCWSVLWELVRGAATLNAPTRVDLSRRYTELLGDNLGQPGFRELLLVAHDVDAGRDVVFALVGNTRRRDLLRGTTAEELDARRAEVCDLAGLGRDHLPDGVAGALAIPLTTDFHLASFAPDGYWRGESHRLADRPGCLARVVDELIALGVEQILLVSAAPVASGPHALAASRLDARGRVGEYLQSSERAAVRDVLATARRAVDGRPKMFPIQPAHNPIGPLDFDGGFDDRSARHPSLVELMTRGYEDAYRQFIEPVVGASGERVGNAEV